MKLGILTTVHLETLVQVGLLRLLVDSIRAYVPRTAYDMFLIVDDCSYDLPEISGYFTWLQTSGTAGIYRLGSPREPFVRKKRDKAFMALPPEQQISSFGHAGGLMAGFWALRQMGCTHVWVIDADCVVLDSGFLDRALELFSHARVAVVTDFFAGRPSKDVQIVDEWTEHRISSDGTVHVVWKYTKPCRAAIWQYGFPNLFCALVDLTVEEQFGGLHNAGWVNSRWGRRLFRAGYRVAYFSFFQDRHVFHLGYGHTKHNADLAAQTFGNAIETVRYGGKTSGIYHAGYLQLSRTTSEHGGWLAEVGMNSEYVRLIAMKPDWLVPPARLDVHGWEDVCLRPFESQDLTALCEIDQSADAVRFLSWGPHGEERTREFLVRALDNPRRWLVLEDRSSGILIGYGEIRPDGDGSAGLSYAIRPAYWGLGFGTILLMKLFEAGYNIFDIGEFWVRIDTEHRASLRTLEKTGQLWEKVRTESYILKGSQRERVVFHYGSHPIQPPVPPGTLDACHEARELALFGGAGMRRFAC